MAASFVTPSSRGVSRPNMRASREVDYSLSDRGGKHHKNVAVPESQTYFDYEAQPPIDIRQGCFLIPVFFAVWWYWTRRAARQAVRVLTAGGEGCFRRDGTESSSSTFADEDVENHVPRYATHDKFYTWDEVLAQKSSSRHLVRWIHITFSSDQTPTRRRIVRPVAKTILHRSPDPNSIPVHTVEGNHKQQPYSEGLLSLDDATSASACNHWECIDDTVLESGTRLSSGPCLAE
eukprot:scaffold528_cov165-Amphora_coffeaeformis.AAC.22